jgi:hypothetical protein
MMRWTAFIGVFAFCCLLIGGALWLRASLASAFSRGEAYGRALSAAEAGAALAEHTAALEAVRRGAERDAVALEVERDVLREKIDDLDKLLGSTAGGAFNGVAPCLDAGVVRALDAIRRPGAGLGAP